MNRDRWLREDSIRNSSILSMNQSEFSDLKSLPSTERPVFGSQSGNVYSEKCLTNQKDFFRFRGRGKAQQPLLILGKRDHLEGQGSQSCDRFGVRSPLKKINSSLICSDAESDLRCSGVFRLKFGFLEEYVIFRMVWYFSNIFYFTCLNLKRQTYHQGLHPLRAGHRRSGRREPPGAHAQEKAESREASQTADKGYQRR